MLRNKIYYCIKPLVPWAMRVAVRRLFALPRRARAQAAWPILPGSEQPHRDWPGWPDGKKFALVLTHDVEGQTGLDKCEQLMDIELALGFRSSFTFVPRGEYKVSRALRCDLANNGFEIAVHDLHHDGKLYQSREDFAQKANSINQYLKDWGAVGFRSAYMLHNLEWLHDLNVQYDASTFDTDPFEPQPDGVGTIFPFWVPRSCHYHHSMAHANGNGHSEHFAASGFGNGNGQGKSNGNGHNHGNGNGSGNGNGNGHDRGNGNGHFSPASDGYAELPYTLPQDSTLFLLFRERSPRIWLQKLDWVARHGGMALVNVHPDYVCSSSEDLSPRTFPTDFYAQLLQYARKKYGDSFWQPLPRELAAFTSRLKLPLRHKARRICMVTYSGYLGDTRVMRYAEALAERGDQVDVLDLQESPGVPRRETVANVNLFHIQSRFGKKEHSKLSFLRPLLRFLTVSSAWLAREHIRKRYDLVHIHNVPDFLVFAGAFPRLTGAKVILDIHDIVPEFYGSKFGAGEGSAAVTALKWMELLSAKVANRIIISNHLWLEKYAARTRANGKCSVMVNNVDASIFRPQLRRRRDGKIIVIFPGGLQWHQGVDIAIRAFPRVCAELPQAEFHIYGDGNLKAELVALTQELGLEEKIRFFEPVSARQIAPIMANADLGVVPKRADSFGNEAYSTKIMEFMSVGVPAVVSNTKIDRYYFDDTLVRFFESGNHDELATAMLEVLHDSAWRQKMVDRALDYAARNSWQSVKADYLNLVDTLIAGKNDLVYVADAQPVAAAPTSGARIAEAVPKPQLAGSFD